MWAVELRDLVASKAKVASAALFAVGATGVQETWMPGTEPPPRQPWDSGPAASTPDHILLIAWFDQPVRELVTKAVAPWSQTEPHWREEPEVDWVAQSQASFPPLQIGTLRVAPPWSAVEGDLIIEPGSGFGTGGHHTTQQALLLFQTLEETGHALDIGCGSGILALAAARVGWTVHGTDIEDAALEAAHRNAVANGLTAVFDTTPLPELSPAPLVFANLHAELLLQLSTDLIRLTEGHLLLAGILVEKEEGVRRAFNLPLVNRLQQDGWVALHYRR